MQMHSLRFLERVVAVDGASLASLRSMGFWELTYGSAFFFFGQATRSQVSSHPTCHIILHIALSCV